MVRAWRASTFQYAASSPWSGEGRGEARKRWGWRWQCRQQQQRRRLVVSPAVRPSPLPEASAATWRGVITRRCRPCFQGDEVHAAEAGTATARDADRASALQRARRGAACDCPGSRYFAMEVTFRDDSRWLLPSRALVSERKKEAEKLQWVARDIGKRCVASDRPLRQVVGHRKWHQPAVRSPGLARHGQLVPVLARRCAHFPCG